MATANEKIRDASLIGAISLRRYSSGVARRVAELLESEDIVLSRRLRVLLSQLPAGQVDFSSTQWKEILKEIDELRAAAMSGFRDLVRADVSGLARLEARSEMDRLAWAAAPIAAVTISSPDPDVLRSIISSQPFDGLLLRDWFQSLEDADRERVIRAIQIGVARGESIDDIVRTVIGTRKARFADGVVAATRRQAQSIATTAIAHISSAARLAVWNANEDILECLVAVATLDGRTTPYCRSIDGKGLPIGDNPLPSGVEPILPPGRPPYHMRCRTVLVAYFSAHGLLGTRPYVADKRTREQREKDFRAEAKRRGVSVASVRAEWGRSVVGNVPAAITYDAWLRTQPQKLQNEVLGPARAKMFRDGMKIDQFVDRNGSYITLKELAAQGGE